LFIVFSHVKFPVISIGYVIVVITLLIVGDSAVTQNVPWTFNSHDVTPVNLFDVVRHSVRLRRGRPIGAHPLLKDKEIKELVDLHNDLRAREGAADMELHCVPKNMWLHFLQ